MVAEKPSVAKLIAEFLSGGRMRFRKGQQDYVSIANPMYKSTT